jgi:hypothetical protein
MPLSNAAARRGVRKICRLKFRAGLTGVIDRASARIRCQASALAGTLRLPSVFRVQERQEQDHGYEETRQTSQAEVI